MTAKLIVTDKSLKVETIEKAAELYASQNKDIFNGAAEIKVTVNELVTSNFLEYDSESCKGTESKCLIDPLTKESLNDKEIVIRQEALGVTAKFEGTVVAKTTGNTLVDQVCERLKNGINGTGDTYKFYGKYSTDENAKCKCNASNTGIVDSNGAAVSADACIISGQEKNNYLSYDNVMWRVMGVYKNGSNLVVKIINDDNVEITVQ